MLIFSTMRFPEVAEHPDTGTVLAMTGRREGHSFPAEAEVPFVIRAMEAGPEYGEDGG